MKTKAMIRVIIFFLIAASIVILAQPAAADEELSMRWDIQGDLTGEAPDVNLIVEVGVYDEEGRWQQYDETVTPLACDAENVEWTEPGDPAMFNGEAYIVCEMQDATHIAYEMTGFVFPQFVGLSGTTVDAELTQQGNEAPVFYHPHIQFGAGSHMSLAVGMNGNGSQSVTAVSDSFSPTPQQFLHAEFGESDNPRIHYPGFAVNGKPLNAFPNILDGTAAIDQTYGKEIFIGYSPATNTYFEGGIYTIDVDPGCAGMG